MGSALALHLHTSLSGEVKTVCRSHLIFLSTHDLFIGPTVPGLKWGFRQGERSKGVSGAAEEHSAADSGKQSASPRRALSEASRRAVARGKGPFRGEHFVGDEHRRFNCPTA